MRPRTTCTDPDVGRLLAAYDAGLLDPGERATFERHTASCEACREGLYELAPHVIHLRERPGQVAAHLAGLGSLPDGAGVAGRAGDAGRPGDAARAPRRWPAAPQWLWPRPASPAAGRWGWAALVPAVAAAVLIVALLGERGPVGGPGAPDAPAVEGPGAVRRAGRWAALAQREALPFTRMGTRAPGDPRVADFDAGMDLYLAGDYAGAAAQLAGVVRRLDHERLDPSTNAYPPARLLQRADQAALYAGIAFLMADRGDSARVHLQRASGARLGAVGDHARWYLAQACLLDDDGDAAAGHLRLLANSPAYSQRAAELLQALDARRP